MDVLFEQRGSRITDFRRGTRLGTRDHVVAWPKPARPQWMTLNECHAFPGQLQVRETRTKHQILVTTMNEPRNVSKDDLAQLHARRWNVELDLRNIKTTMGMDVLHCQTPEMNDKELWVHLLANNLIRVLMAQAASDSGVDPRRTQWVSRGTRVEHVLFELIAQSKVGH